MLSFACTNRSLLNLTNRLSSKQSTTQSTQSFLALFGLGKLCLVSNAYLRLLPLVLCRLRQSLRRVYHSAPAILSIIEGLVHGSLRSQQARIVFKEDVNVALQFILTCDVILLKHSVDVLEKLVCNRQLVFKKTVFRS